MDKLEQTIADFFTTKEESKSSLNLFEMVEQVMAQRNSEQVSERKGSTGRRVYDVVLGQFKAPTEQAGKFDTDERRRFQKYISKNIKGETLAEKISAINRVAQGEINEDAAISEILASLGALKMLQQTLDDFNESTAGFLFEAFLSALLQGTQVTDRVGGTLPIEDCMFFVNPKTGEMGQPVSLKLLSTTTMIEGSIENLLGFFRRPEIAQVANEKGIEYIVATKTKGQRLDVYSFNITPNNFFQWISEKHFNLGALSNKLKSQNLREEVNSQEAIEQAAKRWIKILKRMRYPMMGVSSKQEVKLDWSKITDWRQAVPVPSGNKKVVLDTAAIILSDRGKSSFESFKRGDFRVEDIADLEIAPELEVQYMQEESSDAKFAAAKAIVDVGKRRRMAYLNAISNWGLDANESPGHIQRYYAMLNPKTGQMKSLEIQQYLQNLIDQGPQGIVQWAEILESVRGDSQFLIKPVSVRGRSNVYGTINLDKRAIYRSISKYSVKLEQMCLPIYESLQELTNHINGFYFENRPADAFRAASDASDLKVHTTNLTKEVEEK